MNQNAQKLVSDPKTKGTFAKNTVSLCIFLRVFEFLTQPMKLDYQCLKALSSMSHTWQSLKKNIKKLFQIQGFHTKQMDTNERLAGEREELLHPGLGLHHNVQALCFGGLFQIVN